MKLIGLHIDNFGGLSNFDFGFNEGLNVVLHDNGWGKTTMAAFLKAMLYGYDSKRSKDITENERKRYLPWQGGKYGGYLDFEADGSKYRIYRTFGETPRFDTVKIVNLDSKTTARIPADHIGETLFHLDANAFQRSVFITQNGLSIDGAASSIHSRLNAIVSNANDVAAFDGAISGLTQQIKIYEKTGSRGRLGDIVREIAEKEHKRDEYERNIAVQDAARERVLQIDELLSDLNRDLEEKSNKLEAVSGEGKKRETAMKLLNDILSRIASIRQETDAIEAELGGRIPSNAEIDQVKQSVQRSGSLRQRIEDLEAALERFNGYYNTLLEKYEGAIPTAEQLDDIQNLYGEIQGLAAIRSSDKQDDVPEGYAAILSASAADPDFAAKLRSVVGSRSTIQELIHKKAALESDIVHERELWSSKTKRFGVLKAEVESSSEDVDAIRKYDLSVVGETISVLETAQKEQPELSRREADTRSEIQREAAAWNEKKKKYEELKSEEKALEAELENKSAFSTGKVKPAISKLEEIRRKEISIDEKRAKLQNACLTADEEAALRSVPELLPDLGEAASMLAAQKEITQRRAAVQGLSSRLDGERSKAESLNASLAQLEGLANASSDQCEEPKKSIGSMLIAIGAAITVIGAVLGFVLSPIMFAVFAAGLAAIICGIAANSSYKKKLAAYNESKQAESAFHEAENKKNDLTARLNDTKKTVATLEQQSNELTKAIDSDCETVSEWFEKWAPNEGEVSEAAIEAVIERTRTVMQLRKKGAEAEAISSFIGDQSSIIASERAEIDKSYPDCIGCSTDKAIDLLRTGETDYHIKYDRLQFVRRNIYELLSSAQLTEETIGRSESPRIAILDAQLCEIAKLRDAAAETVRTVYEKYPEISAYSPEDAIAFLREKQNAYRIADARLRSAALNMDRFLKESGYTAEELSKPDSPNIAELTASLEATLRELAERTEASNGLLAALDLDTDQDHIIKALGEADQLLAEYDRYMERKEESETRRKLQQEQIAGLRHLLDAKLAASHIDCAGSDLLESLTIVRQDLMDADRYKRKTADLSAEAESARADLALADEAVQSFLNEHGHFRANSDLLSEIFTKAKLYSEKTAARKQLENQAAAAEAEHGLNDGAVESSEEAALRSEIDRVKTRRDELLIESTQKSDIIRQSDKALELYPDLVREIQGLYEQKQKVQNKLAILKKTILLITKAKENLANRYLSKVEQLFNSYMRIWLNNDTVKGLLDVDFNIRIEENDTVHVAEGYSTGYCDMIDFCMRLALVDTLFEQEQPFLILDDPFVNLDADRLEKALELLNVMAANKQIVYFVCHPIRAIETDESSASRAEFIKLAEETRSMIGKAKAKSAQVKPTVHKSPKELYRVTESTASFAIRPENPDYVITNSIFSMKFVLGEFGMPKDNSFELFFIDAAGHVLNDRQLIEIKGGRLTRDRVRFSLNTRDDSGDVFELMIRETGKDEYEVVKRIPFRAKIAFAGTFNFD